jgi:hypothetical protein
MLTLPRTAADNTAMEGHLSIMSLDPDSGQTRWIAADDIVPPARNMRVLQPT